MTDAYSDDDISYDETLDAVVALDGGPEAEHYNTPDGVVVTDEGITETVQMLFEDTSDDRRTNALEIGERGGFSLQTNKVNEVLNERTGTKNANFDHLKSAAYELGVALKGISKASNTPGSPDFEGMADYLAESAGRELGSAYSSDRRVAEKTRKVQEGIKTGTQEALDYIEDQDLNLEDFREERSEGFLSFL